MSTGRMHIENTVGTFTIELWPIMKRQESTANIIKTPINNIVLKFLIPLYKRLTDEELLKNVCKAKLKTAMKVCIETYGVSATRLDVFRND